MNSVINPCFSETIGSKCPATVFAAPKLGRIALPNRLIKSVYCPHNALLVVSYPGVTITLTGRNLGQLLEGLSSHRLQKVTAIEEVTYGFAKSDVFISEIEVVITK